MCMCALVCVRLSVGMLIYVRSIAYTYICISVHIMLCIHIYIYIYIYIYTYFRCLLMGRVEAKEESV